MSERSQVSLLVAVCGLLVWLTMFRGCAEYGTVGPKAYEHAKALYSICNREDAERLQIFTDSLAAAHHAGEVTSQEQDWLNEIVAIARSGEWKEATAKSRQMMEDQVQGGP